MTLGNLIILSVSCYMITGVAMTAFHLRGFKKRPNVKVILKRMRGDGMINYSIGLAVLFIWLSITWPKWAP